MKKLLKYFTVISSFLFLTACAQEKLTFIGPSDKIVALGDSLTYGYGANQEESYPAVLARNTGRIVINEGINGDTTTGGLNRVQEIIDTEKPALIILSLGGNDMLRKVPEAKIIDNLNKTIDTIVANGIEVVLLAEPKPSAVGVAIGLSDADFYADIAKDKKIPVIENTFSKYLSQEELKSDLIHLNAKGYALVAKDVEEFLRKADAI